jgi:hypothetical protein
VSEVQANLLILGVLGIVVKLYTEALKELRHDRRERGQVQP